MNTTLDNLNRIYYIEKLWNMINKDGVSKDNAYLILKEEIVNRIKLEKRYKNFTKYFKPLEEAMKIIHWEYWKYEFNPPRNIKEVNLNVQGIYEIVNIKNLKRYIGLSKNIKYRWNSHKYDLRRNKHNCKKLQKDWNEFGEEFFKFNIVQIIEEKMNLTYYERYWWENIEGEKYNENSHMISDTDYKIKTLENRVSELEKLLIEKKGKVECQWIK